MLIWLLGKRPPPIFGCESHTLVGVYLAIDALRLAVGWNGHQFSILTPSQAFSFLAVPVLIINAAWTVFFFIKEWHKMIATG